MKGPLNSSFNNGITIKRNNSVSERMVYIGEWYAKPHENGRIKEHRYMVELNHEYFEDKFFEEIDGWFYLRDGIEVHHIDFNHTNNDISNLLPMTKSEHVSLHNRHRNQKRCQNGQFVKNDTKRIST